MPSRNEGILIDMSSGGFPWLTLVVFLPLLGVAAILMAEEALAKWVALGCSSLVFLVSLAPWVLFDESTAAMQFVETHQWIASPSINYAVGVDGISLPLVLLTTLLTPLCVLVSWTSIETRAREFMISLLVMETATLGVFVSLDFVLFYVFWETMLIPMYLLIGIWGGPNRVYAAIKFFLYTLAGSILLLVAIIVLYFYAGEDSFDIRTLSNAEYPPWLQAWLFWAFFAAFAVKVPMFPFHTWLPDAHVEAPTAGSVILASVLLKFGAYGFLRFSLPMLPDATQRFTSVGDLLIGGGHHLRRLHGLCPGRSQKTHRLFQREPHGIRHAWHFRVERPGDRGRDPANGQSRHHHRRALPMRGHRV